MSDDTQENLIRDLVAQYQRQLLFFIFGIYPNHDAAEDILQETNKIIWTKRDEFQPGSNFLAWARTIAKFQTLSYLKTRNSKSWLHFDSNVVYELARKLEDRDSLIEGRKTYLEQCMSLLAEKDQELVLRKYELQETNREISRETGRSEGGLKQAFLRIRRLLRVCVERKEAAAE
ncbi:sigma-70 family RNA polymerase sigma factor [Mariniblastus fucicola]|uniref:RNA polymerase sigma factor n=1 Tax=Mariniblastus fucicola TaxID=980251 RepID=A0A5B9PHV5_9BACT|nr:sigma-70 family RNA polymerase sigma factor [Mariniblastus fucicola]QEG24865.1 RNA polymerase sigma factor [Mariniblastus fucicola]